MSKILPEGVTQNQVDAWKEKHGKVKVITVKRENGEVEEFVIGRPTRDVLDSWAVYHNNDKIAQARNVLKGTCILSGKKELFDKDVNLETLVLKKVQEMLVELEAEEKEL